MQPSNKYISAVLQKLIDEPMEQQFGTGNNAMMLNVSEVMVAPVDVKHPNWAKTIEAIKYLIDQKMCEMHGFCVTFNSAYTKFKKTKILTDTPKIKFTI